MLTSNGPLRRSGFREPNSPVLVFGAVAVGAVSVATLLVAYDEVSAWGLGLALILFVVTAPFLLRSRLAKENGLGPILCLALGVKFVATVARVWVLQDFYGGSGDANRYLNLGGRLAERFRVGELGLFDLVPTSRGTPFVDELSGMVQALIGGDRLANFVFFAWLGFFGLVAMVAAAKRAVPGLLTRRYAFLLLFLPTTVFWSSSLGKDTLMVFFLGVFSLGAARVYTGSPVGFAQVALGIAGISYVRPHLALLALAAFGVALIAGRRPNSGGKAQTSPVLRIAGIVVIAIGFSFVVSQGAGVIPGFSESGVDVQAALDQTERQSTTGGSEIDVASPNNVLEYPQAFFTVMFRPLPFEVRNFTQALASAESVVILALMWRWRSNVAAGIRRATREPYLMMTGLYTLAFGFAWSSVGNLGIIARQRVQVMAFLVLFLCVAATVDHRSERRSEAVTAGSGTTEP